MRQGLRLPSAPALALAAALVSLGPVAAATESPPSLAASDCLVHQEEDQALDYPRSARQLGAYGHIVARLDFDAADQPPQVQLFHRPLTTVLREPLLAWLAGLRMPCHRGAGRETVWRTFAFRFTDTTTGFRRFEFSQLLALARDRSEITRPWAVAEGRCPLPVRWQFLQPYLPNRVVIDGPAEPGHAALVQRLERLELALTAVAADAVWGHTARFEIPCQAPAPAAGG
jgi:hypothetical protein